MYNVLGPCFKFRYKDLFFYNPENINNLPNPPLSVNLIIQYQIYIIKLKNYYISPYELLQLKSIITTNLSSMED